jgi:DNA-binding CsgD family transcriptional regulator
MRSQHLFVPLYSWRSARRFPTVVLRESYDSSGVVDKRGPARAQHLRGRDSECAILARLVADARTGISRVLVLRGEPGVGKTALLDYTIGLAAGYRRVHVIGVESDMELAYAGLQLLAAPLLGYAQELPEPQRLALDVAFGRVPGPTPDRFLVGLAILTLLGVAAAEQPLLCVVDDAQWLDQVSTQTLAFVARRLAAEPVVFLCAARSGHDDILPGLPQLVISGLADAHARELLASVVVGRLDPNVRDRIVAETRGVPLALVQVPNTVTAEELAGAFTSLGEQHSVGRVEEGFAGRISALPTDTRRLLVLAAAEPVGDAALFLRAAARLNIPVDALAPAEAAGVIEFGTRMRFAHPLMRSVAYRGAEPEERRAAHRALAASIDPHQDPDRRAWHAANGTLGQDDAIAAELENSADRARARGGIAAAAAFLERATAMTTLPALRSARALAAAQAKRDASAPAAAHEHLAIAEMGPLTKLQQAQVRRLRAQMEFARAHSGEPGALSVGAAARQLLEAAEQFVAVDPETARETYLEALTAAMYAGRLGEPHLLLKIAELAQTAAEDLPAQPRSVDLLLSGVVRRIAGGPAEGMDLMRDALDRMCHEALRHEGAATQWMPLGLAVVPESAAGESWYDGAWRPLADAMVRHARAAGALSLLPAALVFRAGVHLHAGEFVSAAELLEEASSIAVATGYAPLGYHSVSLLAWRGQAEEALALLDRVTATGFTRGEGRMLCLTGYVGAVLFNGLSRYEEAMAAALRACEHDDFGLRWWCLIELVEAAAHAGEDTIAADALHRLERSAGPSGSDWGLGMLARAQALLADDEAADALFNQAIERLGRTSIVVHQARSSLLYGEWLRRVNRRNDARRHLDEAFARFTEMGADGFAERARRELVAAGAKVRSQTTAGLGSLTAQEAQIARLAADGFTNQEIGSQLFISAHTVEWHLRKVFAKLGINSRRKLRAFNWDN